VRNIYKGFYSNENEDTKKWIEVLFDEMEEQPYYIVVVDSLVYGRMKKEKNKTTMTPLNP
jgi:hypothetical protein